VAVPVTLHAVAIVRGALDTYAVTVAAAKTLLGAVLADDERVVFGECMVGYGRAREAMERVVGDLLAAAGDCDDKQQKVAARIKAGYPAGLRGMDGCRTASLAATAATSSWAFNSFVARSLKLLLLQWNGGQQKSTASPTWSPHVKPRPAQTAPPETQRRKRRSSPPTPSSPSSLPTTGREARLLPLRRRRRAAHLRGTH
jgi:hypothetical protein